MDWARKKKLMFRWSIFTGGLIALFWTIWSLTGHQVPIMDSIKMTENWTIVLPFGISRWWDILIGPIWSVMLILILTSKISEDEDLFAGLTFGLAAGLVAGLVAGLGAGLGVGLIFGLAAGLGVGLIFGLAAGLAWLIGSIKPALIAIKKWLLAE